MNDFDFVIWILLFPLSVDLSFYLGYLMRGKDMDAALQDRQGKGLIIIAIWLGVSIMLYG